MKLAIVILTLDEEAALARSLPLALAEADEVVVSDGNSRDRTADVARRGGATLVSGVASRGEQLARGVAATTADAILVLHADTLLASGSGQRVRQALVAGAVGGGFTMRFDASRLSLRLASRLINLRTRLSRAPLGDQAQFFTRRAYDDIGGVRNWPLLEDLDLIRRLRRRGPLVVLDPPVETSARRYLVRGVARNIATNWLIWSLFWLGVTPQRLARLYRAVR